MDVALLCGQALGAETTMGGRAVHHSSDFG